MQSAIFDRLSQRVPLKTDIEESRLASKMRKAVSKIKLHQKAGKNIREARGGLYSMGARGVYVKDGDIYSRKVVVKARYVKNNGDGFKDRVRKHLDYITRDHAGKEAHKPELFSSDDSKDALKNTIEKFSDAPHNFRFIISPEDGDKLDLNEFSKNLVKSIEKDLGTKLDWAASCHYDTNEPHVHLVINGKNDEGKKLLMTRDYISRGIRNRASGIINKKLGLRSQEDIARQLEISTTKSKKSELDEIIKTNIKDEIVNLTKLEKNNASDISEKLLEKRLEYLETKALAKKAGDQSWVVKESYLDDLRQIERTSSIIERLSGSYGLKKEHCDVLSVKALSEKSQSGQVIGRGYVNEIDDKQYLILKTEQYKHLYVELEKYSEKNHTKVGDWVRITATKAFEGPKASDRSVAQLAQENGGIYDATRHENHAITAIKLPPGVNVQEYVQVHLKRLELMAKMGLATKLSDKSYQIPNNFLESITTQADNSAKSYQAHIKLTQIAGPKLSQSKLSFGLKQ